MADDLHTLTLQRLPLHRLLGRHVNHDSKSRRYAFKRSADPRTLTSKRHLILVPMMRQRIGSCTGCASFANLGGEMFWRTLGGKFDGINAEAALDYAEHIYARATELDPWEGTWRPDDTGSDGLSAAKALKEMGFISGYEHAMGLDATLNALAKQPVMIGSAWLSGMWEPAADGKITVSGYEEGGHEYLLDEIDVQNRRAWIWQSWGQEWGLRGRAWLAWDDLGKLLANYGDCTVLTPLSEPPPQPTPEPAKPQPSAAERNLQAALERFLPTKAPPEYLRKAGTDWLKGR